MGIMLGWPKEFDAAKTATIRKCGETTSQWRVSVDKQRVSVRKKRGARQEKVVLLGKPYPYHGAKHDGLWGLAQRSS